MLPFSPTSVKLPLKLATGSAMWLAWFWELLVCISAPLLVKNASPAIYESATAD
jgi:hypothetical protein